VKPVPNPFSILDVSGPFREPTQAAFSYDYAVQRPNWATPQAVRVKVGISEELDYLKTTMLGISGGSPGQQLRVTQILTRWIADCKLNIADEAGLFGERRDVMIEPFAGPLAYLLPQLQAAMTAGKDSLREEIRAKVKL
jgi:hypothetical protein